MGHIEYSQETAVLLLPAVHVQLQHHSNYNITSVRTFNNPSPMSVVLSHETFPIVEGEIYYLIVLNDYSVYLTSLINK